MNITMTVAQIEANLPAAGDTNEVLAAKRIAAINLAEEYWDAGTVSAKASFAYMVCNAICRAINNQLPYGGLLPTQQRIADARELALAEESALSATQVVEVEPVAMDIYDVIIGESEFAADASYLNKILFCASENEQDEDEVEVGQIEERLREYDSIENEYEAKVIACLLTVVEEIQTMWEESAEYQKQQVAEVMESEEARMAGAEMTERQGLLNMIDELAEGDTSILSSIASNLMSTLRMRNAGVPFCEIDIDYESLCA